jgi:hypothetical protein
MSLFKSNHTYWGIAEKQHRIVENVFSFKEWEQFFHDSNFRKAQIFLERNYVTPPPIFEGFKLKSQKMIHKIFFKITPYYAKMIHLIPDYIVKNFMASGIGIVAEK